MKTYDQLTNDQLIKLHFAINYTSDPETLPINVIRKESVIIITQGDLKPHSDCTTLFRVESGSVSINSGAIGYNAKTLSAWWKKLGLSYSEEDEESKGSA